MSEVGDLVKAVNQGLKAEKAGVSIRQRRNKLCLRAVLPHKDGSNREVQYDVPTGCDATKAGLNGVPQWFGLRKNFSPQLFGATQQTVMGAV